MQAALSALRERLRTALRGEPAHWRFCVKRNAVAMTATWQWEKLGSDGRASRSRTSFETFADCARDARRHGFAHRDRYSLFDTDGRSASFGTSATAPARIPGIRTVPLTRDRR